MQGFVSPPCRGGLSRAVRPNRCDSPVDQMKSDCSSSISPPSVRVAPCARANGRAIRRRGPGTARVGSRGDVHVLAGMRGRNASGTLTQPYMTMRPHTPFFKRRASTPLIFGMFIDALRRKKSPCGRSDPRRHEKTKRVADAAARYAARFSVRRHSTIPPPMSRMVKPKYARRPSRGPMSPAMKGASPMARNWNALA